MMDSEKLDLILQEIREIKSEMAEMKSDIAELKKEMSEVNSKVKKLELHIENETDRNISLLAENFMELTDKLNQAISVADKNLAYEVKVNYLSEEMEKLKQEVAEIKKRIA